MGRYYLDYENFASVNKRRLRAALNSDGIEDTSGKLNNSQFGRLVKFRDKYNLYGGILKGRVDDMTDSALGYRRKYGEGHHTWGERKAARIARNEEESAERARRKALAPERARLIREAFIH